MEVSVIRQDDPRPFCGPWLGEAILTEFSDALMEHLQGDVTIALEDGRRYRFRAIFKSITLELGDVVGASLSLETSGVIRSSRRRKRAKDGHADDQPGGGDGR